MRYRLGNGLSACLRLLEVGRYEVYCSIRRTAGPLGAGVPVRLAAGFRLGLVSPTVQPTRRSGLRLISPSAPEACTVCATQRVYNCHPAPVGIAGVSVSSCTVDGLHS